MSDKRKSKTFIKLIASGSIIGLITSFLLGATAVGVLGAGIGGPAGLVFAILGLVAAFAVYGGYRLFKG